jgi:hypothetical protein
LKARGWTFVGPTTGPPRREGVNADATGQSWTGTTYHCVCVLNGAGLSPAERPGIGLTNVSCGASQSRCLLPGGESPAWSSRLDPLLPYACQDLIAESGQSTTDP